MRQTPAQSAIDDFNKRNSLISRIKALIPEDEEAKGWDIIGESSSCCPGDDAGFGYRKALDDVLKIVREEV